jgi:CDP-paratose 2-epimerase
VVVHTAAQPSHDWAARAPLDDFTINATGTLNLLEATRRHSPEAAFVFTSTNKVYGDTPNRLPLVAQAQRYELDPSHPFAERGIDESMSIDHSTHSLFGVSKTAADLLVQEYGRYFGVRTGIFRAGCLTGPDHSAAELHGFLAYLFKCAARGMPYTVIGYEGKQVRDNIHAKDLVSAFRHFFRAPRTAEVYNIGGGRHSNCSVLEAISLAEELAGRPLERSFEPTNRVGDHMWWISDCSKFESHYPEWGYEYNLRRIAEELYASLESR